MGRFAAAALALLSSSCTTLKPDRAKEKEDDDSNYFIKELPLTGTARIESEGEKELRAKMLHDKGATELALEGEYAFCRGTQLDVEIPYLIHHGVGAGEDGVPAIEVGLRRSVFEDLDELALTVGANVGIPVDEHEADYGVSAFFARHLGCVELHASGGIAWDAHDHAFPWSTAAVVELAGLQSLHPTFEVFGAGNNSTFAPGLVWAPDRDYELALAVPLKLHGDVETIGIAISFLIEW